MTVGQVGQEEMKTNTRRYRIGIDQKKITNWYPQKRRDGHPCGTYYSDYSSEKQAVIELALQIEKVLEKFRIYFAEHGSGLPPNDRLVGKETRQMLIRDALLHLTRKLA